MNDFALVRWSPDRGWKCKYLHFSVLVTLLHPRELASGHE